MIERICEYLLNKKFYYHSAIGPNQGGTLYIDNVYKNIDGMITLECYSEESMKDYNRWLPINVTQTLEFVKKKIEEGIFKHKELKCQNERI